MSEKVKLIKLLEKAANVAKKNSFSVEERAEIENSLILVWLRAGGQWGELNKVSVRKKDFLRAMHEELFDE